MSPLIPKRLRRQRTGRSKGTPALVIAAAMILIPALLVYYAFEHKLPFLSSNYTDYAIVSNSVNVRGGSPVRIAGVTVGQVSKVTADGDRTKIAFTLESAALPIHTDSTLTIRDRLFLEGGYYLALEPGSPSAPVAPRGFTITEPNTATPVQFFQILSTFDVAARANLQKLLDTSNIAFSPSPGQPESDSGAGAFKRALPALIPVFKDTAQVSQALTGSHAGDVETLLTSASDVTTTLANHRSQLVDMIAKLDTVAATLGGEDDAIGQTIDGVDATLKVAPASLTALNRSLTPLDTLARNLTPDLKASGPLVQTLATQVAAVNQVIKPGQRQELVSSLSNLLVRFPTVATRLADFFPATEPAALCLAKRVTPLLEETVQDGSHSTGVPVYKDLVHMLPNLAAASGNFDGNGPYLRALVGLGSDSVPSSLLGSIPGVGSLVGTLSGTVSGATSTGDSLQGTAPSWVGDLTADDFHPEASCIKQPLPTNLQANPADADQ
jgi:phospholipid/cholesterol/gamma-HCH transport system substrate-binding protein